MNTESEQPAVIEKLQRRRDTHREHGRIYRTAWVIAGFIVIAGGVAVIALPGPAFIVVPLGPAMISLAHRTTRTRRRERRHDPRHTAAARPSVPCGRSRRGTFPDHRRTSPTRAVRTGRCGTTMFVCKGDGVTAYTIRFRPEGA